MYFMANVVRSVLLIDRVGLISGLIVKRVTLSKNVLLIDRGVLISGLLLVVRDTL